MNKIQLFLILVLLTFSLPTFSQVGKLENAKRSIKSEKPNSTSRNNRGSTRSNRKNRERRRDSEESGSNFRQFMLELAAYATYGILVETPLERFGEMHYADLSEYPYQTAKHGNFIYSDAIYNSFKNVRFDIYNQFLIENKNLYGNDFGIHVRFIKRFSVFGNYVHLIEKTSGKTENFNYAAVMLKYHRIRTQRFDAWYGIGVTSIFNDVNHSGFTLGFGTELFIQKPVSLAFSHKTAFVNESRVNDTKVLLKYHHKNIRITSGYEYFKLGDSKIHAFTLGAGISL